LTIQNCILRNFTDDGIDFLPSSASLTNLNVSNTFVANNRNAGIWVRSNAGNIVAVFNRVEVVSNGGHGIFLDRNGAGVIAGTAADSVASVNNGAGFLSSGDKGGGVVFLVVRSVAASNGTGIMARDGAVLAIGQSAVFGNTRGWDDNPNGVLQSYGDN